MEPVGIGGVLGAAPLAAWARPETAFFVGSLVVGYAVAMGPVRRGAGASGPGWMGWTAWIGSCLAIETALGSPVAYLASGYLLIAHMVQFVLLGFVAAPLALRAIPNWLWQLLLPPGRFRRGVFWVGSPGPALAFFGASFLLFQTPSITNAALRSPGLYAATSAVLMVATMFLWWPVYGPRLTDGRMARREESLGQLVYVFLTGFPGLALAAALVLFATGPVYQGYATGEAAIGIPPLLDQQLGGILMQVGMTLARSAIFVGVGLAWGARQDAKERDARAGIAGRARAGTPVASVGRARAARPVHLRIRPS